MSVLYKKLKHNLYARHVWSLAAVVLSAYLQAVTVDVFIQPSGLLSGGFLGLSLLISRVFALNGIIIAASIIQFILNAAVAWLCYRGISPRFVLYSMLQVTLGSLFMTYFTFEPLMDNVLLNVIFGGALNGLYITLALKGNASTGGTDFIALYVSNKSGRTIWNYVFFGNVVLLSIFGSIFGWEAAGYSIMFQFVSTKVISTFHKRYQRVTLQITTKNPDPLISAYCKQTHHGISCVEAVGGYSKEKMFLLHTVLSSYEVQDAVDLLRTIDPNIIINQIETVHFYGRFYRRPE